MRRNKKEPVPLSERTGKLAKMLLKYTIYSIAYLF